MVCISPLSSKTIFPLAPSCVTWYNESRILKAAIQGVNVATGTVYAQNTGGPEITINSAIVKDAAGNIVTQAAATGTLTTDGAVVPISVTLPVPQASAMTYTVTLTSTRGGSFVSSSFVVPAA